MSPTPTVRTVAFAALVVWLLALPASAQRETIDTAHELYEAGEYAEALDGYQRVLKSEPENHAAGFMAGQSAYLAGRYQEALAFWLALERVVGDNDLRLKEKLIQACEKLDKPDEVQRRLAHLAKLRAGAADAAYKKKRAFCRDQFRVGDEQFLAHHHFDFPDGDDTCFTIYCVDAGYDVEYCFKFWCMASTNEVSREHGLLKEGERLYHVDEYRKDHSQVNHLHTKRQLGYREFKELVVAELTKRLKEKPQPKSAVRDRAIDPSGKDGQKPCRQSH